jgi:hypothetical protein
VPSQTRNRFLKHFADLSLVNSVQVNSDRASCIYVVSKAYRSTQNQVLSLTK